MIDNTDRSHALIRRLYFPTTNVTRPTTLEVRKATKRRRPLNRRRRQSSQRTFDTSDLSQSPRHQVMI